jgi:Carboxypeptidase regulatory-like domain/TonB-dependent Receptor Plug Domain
LHSLTIWLECNFRARIAIALAVFVCLACGALPLNAQSYRGSIRGEIVDASGAAIVGAQVAVKNAATGDTRTVLSDAEGGYVVPELFAGTYEVTATAKDLVPVMQNALVVVGLETPLNFTLGKVTSSSQNVVVNVEATPLLETTQDVLGGTVEQTLVAELPLNGRDFGKLVALVPGVIVEGSGVAGTEKGFGQFNINGQRDRSNNYTLDGTDNNDPWFNNSALNQVGITGAPASLLPIDAIQEFNLQSQFPAEYGRNSGGVVNIITKSGTNDLHGSAFEYARNSFWDARNFFDPIGTPHTQFINNQFGSSIGGPIIHDKTFFFGAYEGQRERVGSDFDFTLPTTAEINAARTLALGMNPAINTAPLDSILSFFPANNTNSNTVPGSTKDFNDLDNFILKLDHRFNDIHSFAVRYAFGQSNQQFPLGSLGGFGTGSRLPGFQQISPTRVQVVSASLLSALNATHINELRFGYTRFRNSFTSLDAEHPNPNVPDFGTGLPGLPELDFNGIFENLGATAFSVPRARVSQNYQILDNFTWIKGVHTLKFGGEYRRTWVSAFNDNFERGLISFEPCGCLAPNVDVPTDVLTQFFLGNGSPSATTGNTQRTTYNNGFAFFAQDEFRARKNLTITYGLRWEYFGPISEGHNLLSNFPAGAFSSPANFAAAQLEMVGNGGLDGAYRRDLNNFGPRLGVAWSPFQNTVVRAGYGIYYDYIPQDLLIANFTNSAGLATNPIGPDAVVSLNYNQSNFNGSTTGPVFGPVSPGPNSIFVTPRNLATPYVSEWNLNIQRQLSQFAALEIGYVGSKGTRLTRLFDANQDGLNTSFVQVATFATNSDSTYNALQIQARFSNWHRFSGFSAYVFSKSLDGASDGIDFNGSTAAFPQNSDDLKAEKGPSTFDARHRFTSALNYSVPTWGALPEKLAAGWQWNTIITVMSGQPIGIITSDGGINFHQRPNVVPGVNQILPGNPANGYINPLAFSQPDDSSSNSFGDLGRDAVYGPGFWNIDFSLTKNTKLTERLNLQLRAEFFNIFNHPQFALPGGVIIPAAGSGLTLQEALTQCPGCSSSATPDVAQGNPGLGGGGPRVIQFAARLQF